MPNLNYTGAVLNICFRKTKVQEGNLITRDNNSNYNLKTDLNYKHTHNLENPKRSITYKHPSMYNF